MLKGAFLMDDSQCAMCCELLMEWLLSNSKRILRGRVMSISSS